MCFSTILGNRVCYHLVTGLVTKKVGLKLKINCYVTCCYSLFESKSLNFSLKEPF